MSRVKEKGVFLLLTVFVLSLAEGNRHCEMKDCTKHIGFFADCTRCDYFFFCDNSKAVRFKCTDGTWFDPKLNYCLEIRPLYCDALGNYQLPEAKTTELNAPLIYNKPTVTSYQTPTSNTAPYYPFSPPNALYSNPSPNVPPITYNPAVMHYSNNPTDPSYVPFPPPVPNSRPYDPLTSLFSNSPLPQQSVDHMSNQKDPIDTIFAKADITNPGDHNTGMLDKPFDVNSNYNTGVYGRNPDFPSSGAQSRSPLYGMQGSNPYQSPNYLAPTPPNPPSYQLPDNSPIYQPKEMTPPYQPTKVPSSYQPDNPPYFNLANPQPTATTTQSYPSPIPIPTTSKPPTAESITPNSNKNIPTENPPSTTSEPPSPSPPSPGPPSPDLPSPGPPSPGPPYPSADSSFSPKSGQNEPKNYHSIHDPSADLPSKDDEQTASPANYVEQQLPRARRSVVASAYPPPAKPQPVAPAPVYLPPQPKPVAPAQVYPPRQPQPVAPAQVNPPRQPQPVAPAQVYSPRQHQPVPPAQVYPPRQPQPVAPAQVYPPPQVKPMTPAQVYTSPQGQPMAPAAVYSPTQPKPMTPAAVYSPTQPQPMTPAAVYSPTQPQPMTPAAVYSPTQPQPMAPAAVYSPTQPQPMTPAAVYSPTQPQPMTPAQVYTSPQPQPMAPAAVSPPTNKPGYGSPSVTQAGNNYLVHKMCINSCTNSYGRELDGQYSHCGYCSVYLVCYGGKEELRNCQEYYVYDIYSGQCVPDLNKKCSSYGTRAPQSMSPTANQQYNKVTNIAVPGQTTTEIVPYVQPSKPTYGQYPAPPTTNPYTPPAYTSPPTTNPYTPPAYTSPPTTYPYPPPTYTSPPTTYPYPPPTYTSPPTTYPYPPPTYTSPPTTYPYPPPTTNYNELQMANPYLPPTTYPHPPPTTSYNEPPMTNYYEPQMTNYYEPPMANPYPPTYPPTYNHIDVYQEPPSAPLIPYPTYPPMANHYPPSYPPLYNHPNAYQEPPTEPLIPYYNNYHAHTHYNSQYPEQHPNSYPYPPAHYNDLYSHSGPHYDTTYYP